MVDYKESYHNLDVSIRAALRLKYGCGWKEVYNMHFQFDIDPPQDLLLFKSNIDTLKRLKPLSLPSRVPSVMNRDPLKVLTKVQSYYLATRGTFARIDYNKLVGLCRGSYSIEEEEGSN